MGLDKRRSFLDQQSLNKTEEEIMKKIHFN